MKNTFKTIDFSTIKARYNPGIGRHFFDRDTLRFFRSKLPRVGYEGQGGVYFVTSEQFVGSNRVASPRKYTVRKLEGEGRIETVGKFNEMERAEAVALAKHYAGDGAQQKQAA